MEDPPENSSEMTSPPASRAGQREQRESPRDILVIDDNPSNLTAIEVALGEFGRRIIKAGSGREALRHLLVQDFALILLDVQMPQMDGFETARIIRARGRSAHVPIIFITAHHHDDRQMLHAYQLGAADFLFKPIVPEILRAKASVFVALQERTEQVRHQAKRLHEMEQREHAQQLAEERRQWETRRLREEGRRKDEFLAILSHELRNPLASVQAGLDLMQTLNLKNPLFKTSHTVMTRQVDHLIRLVDDLLDISRISHGKIALHKSCFDFRDAVTQAVEALVSAAEEREQSISLHLGSEPLGIEGDFNRVIQVVSNLLSNAIRYTQRGGAITVRLEASGNDARLRIQDDGRGISPQMLDHIFELFAQERGEGNGLGLGLALVQRLIQMHDGSVDVRSDGPQLGSEFEVRLPRTDKPIMPRKAMRSAAAAPPAREAAAPDIKVALVEDQEDLREPMRMLLESWGYEVSTAPDGLSGVELVVESCPDIVLMDVGMPGLDGYQAAQKIHAVMGNTAPRLIAMTGYGSARDRERAREAGFDDHLVKPAAANKLRQILQNSRPKNNLDTEI